MTEPARILRDIHKNILKIRACPCPSRSSCPSWFAICSILATLKVFFSDDNTSAGQLHLEFLIFPGFLSAKGAKDAHSTLRTLISFSAFSAVKTAKRGYCLVRFGFMSQSPPISPSFLKGRAVKFSVLSEFIPCSGLPEPVEDSLPQMIPAA